jgi:hypothetical protein
MLNIDSRSCLSHPLTDEKVAALLELLDHAETWTRTHVARSRAENSQAELLALRGKMAALQQELVALQQKLASQDLEIRSLKASLCWRITWPLRFLHSCVRR